MSEMIVNYLSADWITFQHTASSAELDISRLLTLRGEKGSADMIRETQVKALIYGETICDYGQFRLSEGEKIRLILDGKDIQAEVEFVYQGSEQLTVQTKLTYRGLEPLLSGIQFCYRFKDDGAADWLIPGQFYHENRLAECPKQFPRYQKDADFSEKLTSSYWSFRSDRASLPSVFGWQKNLFAGLVVAERSEAGMTGVGFGTDREGAFLKVLYPYTEEPVVFYGEPIMKPADCPVIELQPHVPIQLVHQLYVAPNRGYHQYDQVIRTCYAHDQKHFPLAQTGLSNEKVTQLAAHGLYHWHYRPKYRALFETVAFDRGLGGEIDRPHMHVAWVSGAPYCYALLRYANSQNKADYRAAAVDVLDFISENLTDIGTFWAEWTKEKGFGTGWNPNKNWVQARTLSEATLFFIRAIAEEKAYGRTHEKWERAVCSNLDFARKIQREDGHFGAYYDIRDGHVAEWQGTGGLLWIAAFLEAAELFDDERNIQVALRGGEAYAAAVYADYLFGAPEDVNLTPTSEDGYNAIISYHALYKKTGGEKWLKLLKHAAEWTMTFRYTYNIEFPKNSFLDVYDFKTRGADNASPANNHLHNYGLICTGELLDLAEWAQDAYFYERAMDHYQCFKQAIVKEDGHLNGYRGMVSERFYHTNAFQPKGMMLGLSHSWCIGLLLYAAQILTERKDGQ
ncbi:hypothetical protein [Listeria costaricensis]|uniref:hypothetical protein n=1 Tax=Listeria costaricensis TaxID=2026604 RepID=UPI000C07E8D5|nr:hypothetical protein [Listeria costaricensis]